jgi:hypothetical protein
MISQPRVALAGSLGVRCGRRPSPQVSDRPSCCRPRSTPARVLRPIDEQAVERAFGGIQSLLLESLLGWRGRGRRRPRHRLGGRRGADHDGDGAPDRHLGGEDLATGPSTSPNFCRTTGIRATSPHARNQPTAPSARRSHPPVPDPLRRFRRQGREAPGHTSCPSSANIKLQRDWIRNSSDPRQFETALHRLADDLDSAPHLIDNQRLREALSNWCIESAIWQLLLTRLALKPHHAVAMELDDRKRQTASMLVWAA